MIIESEIQIRDHPSYNPDNFAETRLKQTIRSTILAQNTTKTDNVRHIKYSQYYNVQKWLGHIGTDLNEHRTIVKELYRFLIKRCALSDRSIEQVYQFLKNFVQHERANITYLKNKNKDLQIYSDVDNKIYPKLSDVLFEINKYDQGNAERITQTLDGIEVFLKEKLELNQKQHSSSLQDYKSLYDKAFTQYTNSFKNVNKYKQKYQHLFNLMMTTEIQGKDFYSLEKKLKKAFLESSKLQQNMGLAVSKLWDECIKQEATRYELIQSALRMYLDKHVTLSTSKNQALTAQETLIYAQLNEITPLEESQESLTVDKVLTPLNIKNVITMRGGDSLDQKGLQQFLYQYPSVYQKIVETESSSLILFKFANSQVDCGTIMKEWKQCDILITVDNMLLIYLHDDDVLRGKYYLKQCDLQYKTRMPLIAELKWTIPGFLFDKHKSAIIQIQAEEYDQFQNINHIISEIKELLLNKQKTFQTIKFLEHDNQYLKNLQFILSNKQLPTPSSVANGFYNLRKIKSTRQLIPQEKQLLDHLYEFTYTMEQPKNVLCEILRDIRQLGLSGYHIIDQIISRSEQFSEQGCAHILATFQHKITSEKDQELLKCLDQQSPNQFSQFGRIKILKLFATSLPWYSSPFYSDPQLLKQCFNSIKQPVEQQALIYIFDAYRFLPHYYERTLLNSSVLQFEQNLSHWQSSQENLIQYFEILYQLNQLNLNLDYDEYFKQCVNTIIEKQFSYQSSLEQFTTVFIDRLTEKNKELLQLLWEHSIKNQHLILNKGLNELFIQNQHLLHSQAQFILYKKNALQQKQYYQKFTVYKILGISINLDKAKYSLILRSQNRSFLSTDEKVYDTFKQIPNFSKFFIENFEECILSIQGQQTYDFMKQGALPFYNQSHQNLSRQYLMKYNDYYPRRYNQYQCRFILDLMLKLNEAIETAPFFYKVFKDPQLEQLIKKSDKQEIIRLQQ
ncbi:hypothetical protein pb186bvf_008429 [Paramecium bursaria]